MDLEPTIGGQSPEVEPAGTGSQPIEDPTPSQSGYEFNPDNYGVTFRSERVVPKDRAHLEELLQLGHSYSANKDKFTAMETDYNTLKGQFQQYETLNNTLKEHPELAQQFETTYQNYMSGQQQQQGAVPPEITERLSTIEQRYADEALAREMADLKAKYPQEDWLKDTGEGSLEKQLYQFMYKNGINNPEHAYRAMRFDTIAKQAEFQGAKSATEGIQAQHRAGVVAQNTASAKPVSKDFKGKSYDDAENWSLQTLGIN